MNRLMGLMTPWRAQLAIEPVTFRQGELLIKADEPTPWIYTTDTGLMSARRTLADGGTIEMITLGGPLCLLLGGHMIGRRSRSVYDIRVRIGGTGWRMRRETVVALMNRDPAFETLVLHTLDITDQTMAEVAACWRNHKLAQRLCRMFLLIQASLESEVIPLGLPAIGEMMDAKIHREARQLADAGIVSLNGHQIVITDLAALETRACGCYQSLMTMREAFFARFGNNSVKL